MKKNYTIRLIGVGSGVIAGFVLLLGLGNAQTQTDSEVIETDTHRFDRIAEDIYHVRGTGAVNVISNGMLVVGEHDVLLVDSHVTPQAGQALIDATRAVTDKPVRYLVNTHYHFDHAHGNQVFPPEVEIIGHRFTREKLSGERGNVLEEDTFLSFTAGVPGQVEELRREVEEEDDPQRREELQSRLAVQHSYMESLEETVPTPPNVTIEDEMRIYQSVDGGGREIRIIHPGRAHTGGDVVVFLPQERIVFTGDLIVPALAYMGDAYVQDWPASLENLRELDFDIILPGHGAPTQDMELIDHFQSYLRDLWQNTETMKAQGLSAEETASNIDMTAHSANFPQISGPGADPRAIRRIYELLDGGA